MDSTGFDPLGLVLALLDELVVLLCAITLGWAELADARMSPKDSVSKFPLVALIFHSKSNTKYFLILCYC